MVACTERECSDGITACSGCNGFGVLTMGGRKYRKRSQGRNIGTTAVAHEDCNGTGMVACGCAELGAEELAMLSGKALESVG